MSWSPNLSPLVSMEFRKRKSCTVQVYGKSMHRSLFHAPLLVLSANQRQAMASYAFDSTIPSSLTLFVASLPWNFSLEFLDRVFAI